MRQFRLFAIVLVLALVAAACTASGEADVTSVMVAAEKTTSPGDTMTTTVTTEEATVTTVPEETTTTEASTEETTTTTVAEMTMKSEEMESSGDSTTEVTTTTTVPVTNPADVCEAPDVDLTLAEQQALCDALVWDFLFGLGLSPSIPLLFLDHQFFVDGESTTLLIRLRSFMNTTEEIRASRESIREATFARFGFPESWLSDEEFESMEAEIDDAVEVAVQGTLENRAFWFGSIAFAYAPYADLLGIDTIVLQIATSDTTTDSGWSTVIYGVDAASVAEVSSKTLSDLLDAIKRRDTVIYNLIYATIFDLFEEVTLPTGDPVDLYETTNGEEDTDSENTEDTEDTES